MATPPGRMMPMSNPLLRADKFGVPATPPTEWPAGAPVPPAADNVPGSPWPPPAPPIEEERLRRGGVATATAVLLAIICATGVLGWQAVSTETVMALNDEGQLVEQTSVSIPFWIWIAMLAGFGLAMVAFFKPTLARITAPLYAVAEGLVLGAISAAFEAQFEGIVLQAVALTIGVFAIMLVLYATGAHPGDRSTAHRHHRGHRRGVPRLLRVDPVQHLRLERALHPRQRARSASASACWWSASRP